MKKRQFLERFLALSIALAIVLALAPPPVARATEYDDDEWSVELWSDETWVEPGGTITYHIAVTWHPQTRGADSPTDNSFQVTDYRQTATTASYFAVSPPP